MTRAANAELPERILAEAQKAVVALGVAGVNMRELARAAGVSATAIYHYYGSKEEILLELRLRAAENLNGRIRSLDPALPPHEFIHSLGRAYLAFADENPHLYKLLFETPVSEKAKEVDAHPVLYFTYRAARDALQRLAESGGYPVDPRYGAMMGWIMLHGFCSLMMSGVLPPAEGMDRNTLRELFLKFYSGGGAGRQETEG